MTLFSLSVELNVATVVNHGDGTSWWVMLVGVGRNYEICSTVDSGVFLRD